MKNVMEHPRVRAHNALGEIQVAPVFHRGASPGNKEKRKCAKKGQEREGELHEFRL